MNVKSNVLSLLPPFLGSTKNINYSCFKSEVSINEFILTGPCGVVSVPEDVGLHRHSPPRRQPHLVLGVEAETCLEITVGDGGVEGRLWGNNMYRISTTEKVIWRQ